MIYTKKYLHDFLVHVFKAIGCSDKDAKQAALVLITADLRGVDSHGIARISNYVRLHEMNRLNVKPKIKITHQTPSTAVIDGDRGLGLVVGPHAMQKAMQKANKVGTGWVAVKNSNHYGIAGFHAMLALQEDAIGISMTNASPLVTPTFGKERLLGTNPLAVAIPAHQQPPLVLDMATTPAANGKLEVLQREGKQTPQGWLLDTHGQSTTDPFALQQGGFLLPLGGNRTHGSHKGYGLAAVIDIFSGVLSGANYGPWVPPFVPFIDPTDDEVGDGIGHFFGVIRVDAFREAMQFKQNMDKWIERFRKATPIDSKQKVIIPGDPERALSEKRSKDGIPLSSQVVNQLQVLAKKLKIPFELPNQQAE